MSVFYNHICCNLLFCCSCIISNKLQDHVWKNFERL